MDVAGAAGGPNRESEDAGCRAIGPVEEAVTARLPLRGVAELEALGQAWLSVEPDPTDMEIASVGADNHGVGAHRLDAVGPVRKRDVGDVVAAAPRENVKVGRVLARLAPPVPRSVEEAV